MNKLALKYTALGRHEEALTMLKNVAEVYRRVVPPNHTDIASAKGYVAQIYSALGRHKEAITVHKDVLVMTWRALPRDHPDVAIAMFNTGAAMFNLREVGRGMHNMQCALNMLERAGLAADDPRLMNLRTVLREYHLLAHW
jgi:tetratricopeptide (TPR) repeat protein